MHENANKKGQHCDGACGAPRRRTKRRRRCYRRACCRRRRRRAIVVAEAGAGVVGSGVALHAVVLVVLLLVLKNSRRGRHLQAIIAKPYTTRKLLGHSHKEQGWFSQTRQCH